MIRLNGVEKLKNVKKINRIMKVLNVYVKDLSEFTKADKGLDFSSSDNWC